MQFLHSKRQKVLNKLEYSINLEYLKFIAHLNEYSEDLNFKYFLKLNPQYTSYSSPNKIIEEYIEYLNEVTIILSAQYYKSVFSYKYTFYKLFLEQDYSKQVFATAAKLEKFVSSYKENLISSALLSMTDETLLPENATH